VAEITEVQDKKQDWYKVKGVVNGKQVSVDIPAPYVDGKSRDEAKKVFERSLEQVSRASS
jgi:hypothetical protein